MQSIASSSLKFAPLRTASRPSLARAGARRFAAVPVKAFREDVKETSSEVVDKLNASTTELVDKVAAYWEASDSKPTIVAVGAASVLALYFINTIITAVDRLPVISTGLELVGLVFTGWTAYRYFLVDGEKAKMTSEIKSFASKVGVSLDI